MTMKKFLHIASVNITLVGLGIVILEAVFGSWLIQIKLNHLNLIKDFQVLLYVDGKYNWEKSTIIYTRDEYGLRGSFSSPREVDIITVGGSTTDQRYINDGYTWQAVIQNEFARAGAQVIFANAGVNGQSTFGHIKNFDWWFPHVPELKPRFILFYVGLNDFYKDNDSLYDVLKSDHSIRQILRERSAIYHLLRTLKGIYMAQVVYKIGHGSVDFEKVMWTDKPILKEYRILMNSKMKAYAARLDTLIDRAHKFGAKPIFVTQPSRRYKFISGKLFGIDIVTKYDNVKYNGVDYYKMMRKVDNVTMQICKERQAICVDLSGDLTLSWKNEDFYDFAHMTPKGARKVGLYLYQKLKEQI